MNLRHLVFPRLLATIFLLIRFHLEVNLFDGHSTIRHHQSSKIHRDLLGSIGFDAWLPCMRSQVRVSAGSSIKGWPGRYIHDRLCGGLAVVLLQLKDPLELFEKRKKIFSGFRFPFRCDTT